MLRLDGSVFWPIRFAEGLVDVVSVGRIRVSRHRRITTFSPSIHGECGLVAGTGGDPLREPKSE